MKTETITALAASTLFGVLVLIRNVLAIAWVIVFALWVRAILKYNKSNRKYQQCRREYQERYGELGLTTAQKRLKAKHGTPAEFAAACYEAVPGDISMDEAATAVLKYNREWAAAG